MSAAECNYEIHDKEMLAIIRALQEWRAKLTSTKTKFRIHSDHEALKYFITKRMLNARQARWAEFIADYDFEITHTPGRSNGKADALTRREEDVVQQKELKKNSRNRILLTPVRLEPQIEAVLISANSPVATAALIPDIHLTTELVEANKSDPELDIWRQKVSDPNSPWTLSDQGLLLHKGRLVISEKDNL